MPVGAAVGIAGVAGAGASVYGANKAAGASQKASDASMALQQQQYAQTRADQSPFMQAGYGATNALTSRLGLSGGNGSVVGGGQGSTGGAQYLPGSTTLAGAGGFSSADLNNIRTAQPGIVDAYNQARVNADPNSPAYQQAGLSDLDSFTKAWYDQRRNPADYTYQPQGSAQTSAVPPKGADAQAGGSAAPAGTYGNTANPTYADPGEFSYTLDDYKASPGFQFQLDNALKGTMATSAATGALRSGAAAKALQDRAQQMAYQDFGNERNFARASFDTDRAFNRQTYADDRNYLTGRYDTETGNLFNLANMGQSAASQTGNAGANYANNSSNALFNNAANQGNAALAGAGSMNSLLSSGVNAFAYSQGYGRGPGAGSAPINGLSYKLNGLY